MLGQKWIKKTKINWSLKTIKKIFYHLLKFNQMVFVYIKLIK